MKSLSLILLSVVVSAPAFADRPLRDVRSATFRPKAESPLRLFASPVAGSGEWTVITDETTSNDTVQKGFKPTDKTVCGVMVPAGAHQFTAVHAGMALSTNAVILGDNFVLFKIQDGVYELNVLCGKGFADGTDDWHPAHFISPPNYDESAALLKKFFDLTVNF